MWLAPIHDVTFAQRVLKSIEGQEKDYGTWPRVHGMLSLAANVSPPLCYFNDEADCDTGTGKSFLLDHKQVVWNFPLVISSDHQSSVSPLPLSLPLSVLFSTGQPADVTLQISTAECGLQSLQIPRCWGINQDERIL